MPILKNPKHERFAQLLAQGKSASEAYVLAGYERNEGNAGRLNRNEQVQARVQELLNAGAEKAGVTVERVMSELAKIGFSDIRKAFTESGGILRPEEWDDEFAGAVASVKVVTRTTGEKDSEDRPVVEHVHEFKAWDKRAALVDLGKHLGMFKEDKQTAPAVTVIIQGKDASIL